VHNQISSPLLLNLLHRIQHRDKSHIASPNSIKTLPQGQGKCGVGCWTSIRHPCTVSSPHFPDPSSSERIAVHGPPFTHSHVEFSVCFIYMYVCTSRIRVIFSEMHVHLLNVRLSIYSRKSRASTSVVKYINLKISVVMCLSIQPFQSVIECSEV
jgi:hypothetical protein